MRDNIRVFLESPRSMELATNEVDAKKHLLAQLPPVKRVRKRRRAESLPPYIPYQSVYERTDFDQMTERQRLMAIKFQTISEQATSLFLTVHGIQLPSKENHCVEKMIVPSPEGLSLLLKDVDQDIAQNGENDAKDKIYIEKENTKAKVNKSKSAGKGEERPGWNDKRLQHNKIKLATKIKGKINGSKNQNNTVKTYAPNSMPIFKTNRVMGSHKENHPDLPSAMGLSNGSAPSKANPVLSAILHDTNMPYNMSLTCSSCAEEISDLYGYLHWLSKKHRCPLFEEIELLKKSLGQVIECSDSCICNIEEEFYNKAVLLGNYKCCALDKN